MPQNPYKKSNGFITNKVTRIPSIWDKDKYDEPINRTGYTRSVEGIEREKRQAQMLVRNYAPELLTLLERAMHDVFWEQSLPHYINQMVNNVGRTLGKVNEEIKIDLETFGNWLYGSEPTEVFKDNSMKLTGFSFENKAAKREKTADGSVAGTSQGSRDMTIFASVLTPSHKALPTIAISDIAKALNVTKSADMVKLANIIKKIEKLKELPERSSNAREIMDIPLDSLNRNNAKDDFDSKIPTNSYNLKSGRSYVGQQNPAPDTLVETDTQGKVISKTIVK